MSDTTATAATVEKANTRKVVPPPTKEELQELEEEYIVLCTKVNHLYYNYNRSRLSRTPRRREPTSILQAHNDLREPIILPTASLAKTHAIDI